MDAGIATEDNLKMLRKEHYDYVCVSRSNLKEYQADTDSNPVVITDKRQQPIELMKVTSGEHEDEHFLWVRSKTKALKEQSMNGLLAQLFKEGIQAINEGIHKKIWSQKA